MALWVGKKLGQGHSWEYALSCGSNQINTTVFPSVCLSDCLSDFLSVIIVLQLPQLLFENRTSFNMMDNIQIDNREQTIFELKVK